MKRLLVIFFIAMYASISRAQVLESFNIVPSTPTVDDSIVVMLKIGFPWCCAKKQSSFLNFVNDTIIYNGCYYHPPALLQAQSYIYDTIRFGALEAGEYSLILLRKYVYNYGDTNCLNIAFTDTLDTAFVVSQVSSVYKPTPNPLQVFLYGNELRIYSSEDGLVQLLITDISGRTLKADTAFISRGHSNLLFSLQDFPPGLYFATIQTNQQRITQKFIKLTGY